VLSNVCFLGLERTFVNCDRKSAHDSNRRSEVTSIILVTILQQPGRITDFELGKGLKNISISLQYARDNEQFIRDLALSRTWKLTDRRVNYESKEDVFGAEADVDGLEELKFLSLLSRVVCAEVSTVAK